VGSALEGTLLKGYVIGYASRKEPDESGCRCRFRPPSREGHGCKHSTRGGIGMCTLERAPDQDTFGARWTAHLPRVQSRRTRPGRVCGLMRGPVLVQDTRTGSGEVLRRGFTLGRDGHGLGIALGKRWLAPKRYPSALAGRAVSMFCCSLRLAPAHSASIVGRRQHIPHRATTNSHSRLGTFSGFRVELVENDPSAIEDFLSGFAHVRYVMHYVVSST
jgi:hypothetical protein